MKYRGIQSQKTNDYDTAAMKSGKAKVAVNLQVLVMSMYLTAKFLPVSLCVPRWTVPKPPTPIGSFSMV